MEGDGGSKDGEQRIPGGCKIPESYFNTAEVLSQEDWEIEPQKPICSLLGLALN